MKVGNYKVKRNYLIAQMAVDAFSLIILVATFQCTMSFKEMITRQNALIKEVNDEIGGLLHWEWNLIWFILAVLATGYSLFLIYHNKKLPVKYKITEATAQRYSDIYITAVTCIRIPVLLAIFEGMYMHQSIMMRQTQDIFSLQIPLDILLTVIIIRFSLHRVKALQPKEEKEEREIIEG